MEGDKESLTHADSEVDDCAHDDDVVINNDAAADGDDDDDISVGIPESELPTFSVSKIMITKKKGGMFLTDGQTGRPDVADVTKQKKNNTRSGRKKTNHFSRICEVLIFGHVILALIGLFCLPTVFYVLPTFDIVQPLNKTDDLCLEVEPYSGEVCTDMLTSLQICFSGETSPPPPLEIPSVVDQEMGERNARNVMAGLNFLRPPPSDECIEAIVPFTCQFFFKLCDSDGHLHTVLREDCLRLRDDICAEAWKQAVDFLGEGALPACEDLPDLSLRCINDNNSSNMSLATPSSNILIPSSNTTDGQNASNSNDQLVCGEGFFFDENGTDLCRPTCGEFNPLPYSIVVTLRLFIAVCLAASIIMFVLVVIQRKTLLIFPTILYFYLSITTFVMSGTLVVGFFSPTALFCGHRDFIMAVEKGNQTPFCTISGTVFTYTLEQICVWAVLHTIFLFWGVVFPFSYRQLRAQERIRYAHVISVVLGLTLPLPGALIHLRDGFVLASTPTFSCVGRNLDFTFYTLVIPLSVIVGVTSCLLVVILWKILKEFVLKNLMAKRKANTAGKAQLKITITIVYYTILGVMGLIAYTYYKVGDSYQERITDYILCESSGFSDCILPSGGNSTIVLSTMIILLVSLLPVNAIFFTIDTKIFKKNKKKSAYTQRSFIRSTTASSLYGQRSFIRSNTATSVFGQKSFTRSNTATSQI